MQDLSNRLAGYDAAAVRTQAHALKGAAATLSAGALRTAALQVEKAAEANDLSLAREVFPRVNEQFERLAHALKRAGLA